jgi:hypothetical protein
MTIVRRILLAAFLPMLGRFPSGNSEREREWIKDLGIAASHAGPKRPAR